MGREAGGTSSWWKRLHFLEAWSRMSRRWQAQLQEIQGQYRTFSTLAEGRTQ